MKHANKRARVRDGEQKGARRTAVQARGRGVRGARRDISKQEQMSRHEPLTRKRSANASMSFGGSTCQRLWALFGMRCSSRCEMFWRMASDVARSMRNIRLKLFAKRSSIVREACRRLQLAGPVSCLSRSSSRALCVATMSCEGNVGNVSSSSMSSLIASSRAIHSRENNRNPLRAKVCTQRRPEVRASTLCTPAAGTAGTAKTRPLRSRHARQAAAGGKW